MYAARRAAEADTSRWHPEHLVSLLGFETFEGVEWGGYAAFEVNVDPQEGPQFRSHFRPCHLAGGHDVFDIVAELVDGRAVLLCDATPCVTLHDRRHVLATGVGFLDRLAALGGPAPSDLMLATVEEADLERFGTPLGLYQDRPGMETERWASDRIQLSWLFAMLQRAPTSRAADTMLAAWQAWRMLESVIRRSPRS